MIYCLLMKVQWSVRLAKISIRDFAKGTLTLRQRMLREFRNIAASAKNRVDSNRIGTRCIKCSDELERRGSFPGKRKSSFFYKKKQEINLYIWRNSQRSFSEPRVAIRKLIIIQRANCKNCKIIERLRDCRYQTGINIGRLYARDYRALVRRHVIILRVNPVDVARATRYRKSPTSLGNVTRTWRVNLRCSSSRRSASNVRIDATRQISIYNGANLSLSAAIPCLNLTCLRRRLECPKRHNLSKKIH